MKEAVSQGHCSAGLARAGDDLGSLLFHTRLRTIEHDHLYESHAAFIQVPVKMPWAITALEQWGSGKLHRQK